MSDLEARIDGEPVTPDDRWSIEWVDREAGIARATRDSDSHLLVVEGEGSRWHVVHRGRRIPVEVATRRERILAQAEGTARGHDGPAVVTATLPGLVVAIAVSEGDEVQPGAPLLTIEAMKMQNEVRAPRAGRVTGISVLPGEAVATGALLLRIE